VPAAVLPVSAAGALARAGFYRWASYRQAAIAGMFTNIVFGVIKLSILLAMAESAGGSVAGYDPVGLSTYTWLAQGLIAVVMIFSWTELADRVRTGDIAVDLARPVDLQLSWLAADLGRAAWGLLSRALVPIAFGAALFGFRLPDDPAALLLLPVSVTLAVGVSFACRFMLNLLAFWVTEVRGPVLLYVLVSGLLGGHLIPVQLFPDWLQVLAYATPFPAIIQVPIDLVTGHAAGWAAVAQVLAQLAWVVALLGLGRVVLSRATRRLVVQGG
jgi:viologen exporter family transport system permease protein